MCITTTSGRVVYGGRSVAVTEAHSSVGGVAAMFPMAVIRPPSVTCRAAPGACDSSKGLTARLTAGDSVHNRIIMSFAHNPNGCNEFRVESAAARHAPALYCAFLARAVGPTHSNKE